MACAVPNLYMHRNDLSYFKQLQTEPWPLSLYDIREEPLFFDQKYPLLGDNDVDKS